MEVGPSLLSVRCTIDAEVLCPCTNNVKTKSQGLSAAETWAEPLHQLLLLPLSQLLTMFIMLELVKLQSNVSAA